MPFKNIFESHHLPREENGVPSVEEYKASDGAEEVKMMPGIIEPVSLEKVAELWADLNKVGKTKALGYLPVSTLVYILRVTDLNELANSYQEKGLKTKFMYRKNGQLFNLTVWDEQMLQQHLDKNSDLIINEGWPSEADAFVKKANTTIAEKGPLYDIIARAYNDKRYQDMIVTHETK